MCDGFLRFTCAVVFFFLPSDVPLLRVCISALPVLSKEELQGCLSTLYPRESVSVHKVGLNTQILESANRPES